MNELALAAIVLVWVAVPASLLILVLTEVVKLEGEERFKRWIRGCLLALAPPLLLILASFAWGWAGAAHLEPLCSAYATPEFRQPQPLSQRRLWIDSDQTTRAGDLPAWSARLVVPNGPFEALYVEGRSSRESAAVEQTLRLEVRRLTHHRSRLFHVQLDRFTLVDPQFGRTLAIADELWVDAGRHRYHCGIGSGRYPTERTSYPDSAGVANFLSRALTGKR